MKLVTHTFHPSEYTAHIAYRLTNILRESGYDTLPKRIPFGETGWGKALSRAGATETLRAIVGNRELFEELASGGDVDYIIDLHAGDERITNPKNRSAEDLPFERENYVSLKNGGMFYRRWQTSRGWTGIGVEIPQVYRESSEKFQKIIDERTSSGDMVTRNRWEPWTPWGHFKNVCDRKATLGKYPPDIIAEKIARRLISDEFSSG